MDLNARKATVLARLDLRTEYERLGIRFAADRPNTEGWLTCRAMGREDRVPSAGVNLESGLYHDFGTGESLSLFDFAVRYGEHTDWQTALDHYALQVGVNGVQNSHVPTRTERRLEREQLVPVSAVHPETDWQGFLTRRPPITVEAIQAAGARAAHWPAGSPDPDSCLVFAGYSDTDPASLSVAYLLYRADGQDFPAVPQAGLKQRKTHLLAGSQDSWVLVGGKQAVHDSHTIWKVEGVPDALALSPHLPAGQAVVTNTHGADSKLAPLSIFENKQVVVVGDADIPGQRGAEQFARRLRDAGHDGDVRILQLPFEVKEKHGLDLRDFFLERGDFPTLWQLKEQTEPVKFPQSSPGSGTGTGEVPPADDREVVPIVPDVHLMTAQVAAVIGRHGRVFQRAGKLVRVLREAEVPDGICREPGSPRIQEIPHETLRDCISEVCRFTLESETQQGRLAIQKHPPLGCVKAVSALGEWPGVRRLEAVVDSPILRRDGTVLCTAGYDPGTGLLSEPSYPPLTLPDNPTRDDVHAAVALLLDLVGDFPFQKPEHRAAWLAYLLTSLARFAFSGPAPLFLVDANTRGSGKSLLCDLVSMIVSGRSASRMHNPRDDEECRKQITSLVISGDAFVLLDNIVGPLGNAALDAALTGTSWKDRRLGKSEMVEMPLYVTWSASGNNVILQGDIPRRICHIRLESAMERPEERTGFKYPQILQYAREQRGTLLAAALTILRGYFAAGAPDLDLKPWGSFEGWTKVVRNAVVWAGQPDPGETKQNLIVQSDRETNALAGLLTGLAELDPARRGLTATQILNELKSHPEEYLQLREALGEICYVTSADQLPSSRQLGSRLGHQKMRVIGGRRLINQIVNHTSVWLVEDVGEPSLGCTSEERDVRDDSPAHGGAVSPRDVRDDSPAPSTAAPARGDVRDDFGSPSPADQDSPTKSSGGKNDPEHPEDPGSVWDDTDWEEI